MTSDLEGEGWEGPDAAEDPGRDRVSLVLAIATVLLVAGAAWLRFGPGLQSRSIQVGEPMPPIRLAGLHDPGSRLLLGVEGEVLWVVLLSAESPESAPLLAELEPVWDRLRSQGRFGMAVATTAPGGTEHARAALEAYRGKVPLYLAGRAASRAFGVDAAGAPWHFLVDPRGRIAAVARGSSSDTVERLAKMAGSWLDGPTPEAEIRARLVDAGGRADMDIVGRAPRS